MRVEFIWRLSSYLDNENFYSIELKVLTTLNLAYIKMVLYLFSHTLSLTPIR